MPFKQHDRQYDLVVFGATGKPCLAFRPSLQALTTAAQATRVS